MDFSDLVKEDDLEHLSDKSRGDGGRRSSSNTGRRSSRSKKIKRESDGVCGEEDGLGSGARWVLIIDLKGLHIVLW